MITVKITGLEPLLVKYNTVPFNAAVDRAVEQAAGKIRDDTKKMPPVSAKTTGYGVEGIPVDTGRMRQAVMVQNARRLAADIVAKTDYSLFVHEGTRKMPARPFFRWALQDFGGLKDATAMIQKAVSDYFNTNAE